MSRQDERSSQTIPGQTPSPKPVALAMAWLLSSDAFCHLSGSDDDRGQRPQSVGIGIELGDATVA